MKDGVNVNRKAHCGAKTRDGSPCQRAPLLGRTRCKLHGGRTPIGPGLPQFKDGRHSRYLPTRLAARYDEAQADQRLLELRDDIALLDARIADLLARVDTGEAGSLWKQARDAYQAMLRAQRSGDSAAAEDRLRAVGDLLDRGAADHALWSEIMALLDPRRRLVESERRRLLETDQMIAAERVLVLIATVADIVKRYVTDRQALAGISEELRRLAHADAATVH